MTSFIAPALPKHSRNRTSSHQTQCSWSPTSISRRDFLSTAATLVTLSGTLVAHPLAAAADRTGKYSTKLTAKRRYLPRITAGMAQLAAIGPAFADDAAWPSLVSQFLDSRADDMHAALDLFGTTFFSEGNKISPLERSLSESVENMYNAIAEMKKVSARSDVTATKNAYIQAVIAANKYISTAKLTETIPLIPDHF